MPPPPVDDDLNPGSYAFGDAEPEVRAAPPLTYDKYATSEPEGDDEPRPKRKKRKPVEEENEVYDPVKPPVKVYPFDTLEPKLRSKPWWFWPTGLAALGLICFVIAAIVLAAKSDAQVAVLGLAGAGVGVLIETFGVALILMFVGYVFGIDYGQMHHALLKLVACISFVNGFLLLLGIILVSFFGYLGILMAFSCVCLVSFIVFQTQFKLSMYETLITLFAIQFCGLALLVGLGMTFMNAIK